MCAEVSSMGFDDAEAIRLKGLSPAESMVPPDRYAVPAPLAGELPRGTKVTVGGSRWWIIDQLAVAADEPTMLEGRECYACLPEAEFGAAMVRPQTGVAEGHTRVVFQYPAVEDLWVYQDAPTSQTVTDVKPFDPMAWYERMMDDPSKPPPKRVARPARELPSLTGRVVRFYSAREQEWMWLRVLSEPLTSGPHITVSATTEVDYWRAVFGRRLTPDRMVEVELHRIWAY